MLQTPLHNLHTQHGAKMVEYAGWQMPILYSSIVEEHHHTRQVGSIFDVSHMGRLTFKGDGALDFLDQICTRNLAKAQVGQSCYTHVCNETGGILDDVIVSRYENHWLMVCNAANRAKIVDWLNRHQADFEVTINDETTQTLMVAIQGPKVIEMADKMLPIKSSELKRYRFTTGAYMGVPYSVFRSGYTGEDGVEIILPANIAAMLGGMMQLGSGPDTTIKPAGLGARDTLRLEAGMPLYGHELHEQTNTLEAGLDWCVDLNKDFIGADALRKVAQTGPARKLVGLELDGRRIARQGTTLSHENQNVGEVTSGTFGPTVQKSIAMALCKTELAQTGQKLSVLLKGKPVDATVVDLPFYKRS